MRLLYVFPHPDDESFGPGPGISAQVREGHEVFLLTLTRGEATSMRHKLSLSKEQMGEVRLQEMQSVERVYRLSGMTVLGFPDSGLKELDPRQLEQAIEQHIRQLKPQIVITYPAHGVSGFHDHLVTHAVVKRVFCQLSEQATPYLRRLAFFTIDEQSAAGNSGIFKLNFSTDTEIDCRYKVEEVDLETFNKALDCYETYVEVIKKTDIRNSVGREMCYEIFGEQHEPPLGDLSDLKRP